MHAHPPSVLAIDTATEVCSVALLHRDSLTELIEQVGSRHSERVLPMIDTLLSNARLQLSDIDLFAFGAGPGSFTGLRIACGVAQGLAYGSQKRVAPIGNLRALAAGVFESVDQGDRLLAAIDARMQQGYCAIYQRDSAISEIRTPSLESPQSLPRLAAEAHVDIVAGNALTAFADVWPQEEKWSMLPLASPTAGTFARLARLDAERGLDVSPAEAIPIYVRDQVALTIEQRQTGNETPWRSAEAPVPHASAQSAPPL